MKFFSLIVALLGFLPFLAAAFPVADPVAEPEMHLEKRRSAQTCRIVNLRKGEYVNCRYGPTTKAGNIFAFRQGQKRTFSCKKKGQCIKGNCTWDRITLYGVTCYVSGYYTDSRCSSKRLPKC
ncbi:uncharacterized protein BDCG_00236 [Blastomyces dermatitidis ER-3]|uniref:Uncharacterized protein n=1 Tax=Ajellomyces dermatitidis (strain ER-3 / ATCC MYA-2586) TaxID=559297 RepID=A0ABP2EMZ6_AJEDR|nr:uncharacterized protein BDCG_00236 [Blastomyces dermatitidis ER-3]EEQ83431.2 hypothetical protein BDCG_00236 [Blastomyces dermatitidis ER-3]